MDRFDELTVFLAIVDEGSLAAAARRLRRSPAAITRALAALEERVGVRLVERTTRSSSPTQAGLRLAERSRGVLSDYDDALLDASGDEQPRGRVRIAAPQCFGRRHIAPIVGEFLDAYPEVRAELLLDDDIVDLVGRGLDVALRIGALDDTSLNARRVGAVRQVVTASPDYLARKGTPSGPDELAEHELIWFARRSPVAEWRFPREGGGEHVVRIDARLVVDLAEVAVSAACDGRGIAATLSYQVADEIADGRLVRILTEHEGPAIPVQLVFGSRRLMPPRIRAFIDFAVPRLETLAVVQER